MDDRNTTTTARSVDPAAVYIALEDSFRPSWRAGLAASCACLLLQLAVLAAAPGARRHDQLVLLQLTAARLLNTAAEYCIMMNIVSYSGIIKDAVFVMCMYTDLVLVCWMFVFSKNLYDKVVMVFAVPARALHVVSALVWSVPLPAGLLCPVLLRLDADYFLNYYRAYAFVKFLVVAVNALLFVEIFTVAFRRGLNSTRDIGDLVKSAAVACALVAMTSVQVFLTDLLSIAWGDNERVTYTFCVLNSYQAVLVTSIFIILTKSKLKYSIKKAISLRLTEVRKL